MNPLPPFGRWGVLVLAQCLPLAGGEDKAQEKPATPAEEYKALLKAHLNASSGGAMTDEERLKFVGRVYKFRNDLALKFVGLDREKLTWRSFADPGALGQGPIVTRWNLVSTPTYYVIDHQGVIRHKWVGSSPGEKAIDAALEKLIAEAEEGAKKAPR